MSKSTIAGLDCTDRVRKRSQWEAFEFSLLEGRGVEVANHSYSQSEVADHTYAVEVENGTPVDCTCPAAEHFEEACKHQLAVAIRQPLIAAVTQSADPEVSTGGGVQSDTGDAGEVSCPNDDPRCDGPTGDAFPCFACYCDGQEQGV